MLYTIVLSLICYSEYAQFVIDRFGRLSRMSLTWHPDQLTLVSRGGATKLWSVWKIINVIFWCFFASRPITLSRLIIGVKHLIVWNVVRLTLFVTWILLKISTLVSCHVMSQKRWPVLDHWGKIFELSSQVDIIRQMHFVEQILNNVIIEIWTTFVSLTLQIRTKGWVCWSA